MPENFC